MDQALSDFEFEPSTEFIGETFDNGIADGTLCLSEISDEDDFAGTSIAYLSYPYEL